MTNTTLTYPLLAALGAVAMPFVGFILTAMVGKKARSGALSISSIIISLALSVYVIINIWNKEPLHICWEWFTVGNSVFAVGILLNNLSAVMLLLVPLIAVPVHIYSVAYMKGDAGIHRYWMFLSLFCFAMLGLVIADNLLLMYVFWELVGFASYLLIGFWFTKDAAVQANKKAFIINRIGDLGFLAGIALIYSQFGTLDLQALFGEGGLVSYASVVDGQWISGGNSMPAGWLTATGIAFFIGAMAKSAQFPLHVWLPDAMEGPTAVSSLIHAATMVAAGVFLLVRIFPIFDANVLLLIVLVGTITAFVSAFFALTQNDIKKILAFSTISQLGLMVTAVGIGSYHVAIFHLVTHAFFKCLLFLSAGAVIHEMQHIRDKHALSFNPQDIRNMGGLRLYMPVTFVSMLVGSLALAGVPLTSGYLSKDILLIQAYEWSAWQGGILNVLPYVLFAVSALTTFYIARFIYKIFFTSLRITQAADNIRPHEARKTMLAPMVFLALCSLFPLFSLNPIVIDHLWLTNGIWAGGNRAPEISSTHIIIPVLTSLVSTILAIVAWAWYVNNRFPLKDLGFFYRLSYNQGYLDGLYQKIIVIPTIKISEVAKTVDRVFIDGLVNATASLAQKLMQVADWLDRHIIDGFVRAVADVTYWLGNILRRSQNGRIQYYLFTMFAVVILVLLYHLI